MDRPPLLAAGLATAITALLSVAGLLWLALVTAGTREPFNADPVVLAMGVPARGR
ncbi:MAG TPA: hypothetical protein VN222_09730 [Novosphingobium sp.]|nr:hypothetical protein [Novosphingobium sp.]